jgi:predicted RNA binding protein YcfA (HicA-like mRNA interferase family)
MPKISPIDWKDLAKFFESHGWVLNRIKGDHLVYAKEGFSRPVVIPKTKEVQVFIIVNNLHTAKIDRDTFLKAFKRR